MCYCMSKIGHFIVVAGAVLKSAREIGEMYRMGLWEYLHTTVSIIFDRFYSTFFLLISRDRFFLKILWLVYFVFVY